MLIVQVIGHLSASSLEDDIIGQQLWEALQANDDYDGYEKRGAKLSFEHKPYFFSPLNIHVRILQTFTLPSIIF